MNNFRFVRFLAPFAGVTFLAFAHTAPAFSASALYAETRATLSTSNNVAGVPISGLTLNLPAVSAVHNVAIVTLSLPNLSLSQPVDHRSLMTADLEVVAPFAPGGLIAALGSIGVDTLFVNASTKKPITIVLKVPLGSASQVVQAEWDSPNATVTTDTFASISAILTNE